MDRITEKHLRARLDTINALVGANPEPYSNLPDGTHQANPGTYCLDQAYGGVKLAQIMNTSGGERDVFGVGYVSKRALYDLLSAFVAGLQARK